MTALQTGLFSLLSMGQTTPVYDFVPEGTELPYITLGAFTCKQSGAKTTDAWDTSIQIHLWSDYKGKAEINGIANDVITVLSSVDIELMADKFKVISQEVEFFEAWEEEELGYHGVITLVTRIQNLGE
jgi:ABC-type sulfate transport system substrate-binding protein